MAGRIVDEDIAALRERANIAAVISDYTSLRRTGSTLKGLCPFHDEKTPSFNVDPGRNFFHCFGCGEGGDAIGFLQKIESLTFPEAVERLARIVGMELRYAELAPGQRKALGRRTRLTHALAEAADFYRQLLLSSDGGPAREYLKSRGLDRDTAAQFGLGWSHDQWDGLVRHLAGKGFDQKEIADAGLASEGRRGGLVDRFRGRVMFPIYDSSGKDVVAFGGRIIPGMELSTGGRDGTPPKYINSSESAVYKKSQTLYGLNWARAEVTRRQAVLVVEGYLDVIGLHTAGVRNVVATCGTALTSDHFRALEKFAPKVILALDADEAGFAAADRARETAEEVGIRDVAVLPLPPGKDPADLADAGSEAVAQALQHVQTAVEFQIMHLLRGADTSTPEGQVAAYRRTFPLLLRLPDRFVRYRYIRDMVAPATHISADRIEAELDAQPSAAQPAGSASAEPRPRRAPGDVSNAITRDPQLLLERDVLRLALQAPHLLPPEWKLVSDADFRAPMSKTLFAAMQGEPAGDLAVVLERLPDDDMRSRVRALALSDVRIERDGAYAAADAVARLRAAALQRRSDELREEVARVGEQLDLDSSKALLREIHDLEQQARAIREGREA